MTAKDKETKKITAKSNSGKRLRLVFTLIAVAVVIAAIVFLYDVLKGSGNEDGKSNTYTVARRDLPIKVIENGGIKAIETLDIKSEVEGRTTIIKIVDEGTTIEPEDVNNLVLVELDSSEIKEKLTQQEIKFLTAEASYTEAKESLDIQIKQNISDIQTGKIKVKFALMDFKKYLGERVAEVIIEQTADPNAAIDMASSLNNPQLGGSASQKLKELRDDILVTESEFEQASDTLTWTEKLFEKQYVAETELRKDQLKVQSAKIKKEKAEIALQLFNLYEFPKEAEKLLSDYKEALLELERVEASARSKLAQAKAKLESADATYSLQKELLEKLQKQLAACIIKAPKTGQVVYASSLGGWWEKQNRPIKIGADIRERQKIIAIPDPTGMKVDIKIHETWVDKVEVGQSADITIEAFPDKAFKGQVIKKSPLADPEHWMNPDLKVYTTDVQIDGIHDFIKIGMTAKVEILINELKDVISVPIQTVVNHDGKKFCYVLNSSNPQKREVETGLFNNDFVEIKSGLSEGENVLLNPPRISQTESSKKEK